MTKKRSDEYSNDGDDSEYEVEPCFDDPEGYVDDITEEGMFDFF